MTKKNLPAGSSPTQTGPIPLRTDRGRLVAWLVIGSLLWLTTACISGQSDEVGSDLVQNPDDSSTTSLREPDDGDVLVVDEEHISEEVAEPPAADDDDDDDRVYDGLPDQEIPPELVAIGDDEALVCAKIQFAMDARDDGAADSDNPVLKELVAEPADGESEILKAVGRIATDVTDGSDAGPAMTSAMTACEAEGYEP